MSAPARMVRVQARFGASAAPLPPLDLHPARVRIGSAAEAEVRLPMASVGPDHAELRADGDRLLLTAAQAVRVGGAAWPLHEPGELVLPAELELGGVVLALAWSDAEAASSHMRTASLARELVRGLLQPSAAAPAMVIEAGPAAGQRRGLPIAAGRVVIGRGEEADWIVLDPDLSRAHVAVEVGWDGTRVRDLGSKNGSRLGAAPVPTGPEGMPWTPAARLVLGATVIRLDDAAQALLDAAGAGAAAGDEPGGADPRPPAPTAVAPGARPPVAAAAAMPASPQRAPLSLTFWVALSLAAAALAGIVWILLG